VLHIIHNRWRPGCGMQTQTGDETMFKVKPTMKVCKILEASLPRACGALVLRVSTVCQLEGVRPAVEPTDYTHASEQSNGWKIGAGRGVTRYPVAA
jgi:hypothetical protein